jgi:hypothetical protein
MITEQAKQDAKKTALEEEKQEAEEIIKAAAIYERLDSNPDFQQAVEHMKGLVKVHEAEIGGWMAQMESASFFKRIKIMDTIMVHQIRKSQIQEAIAYPKRIVFQAQQAREFLRITRLKEKAND